MEKCFNRVGFAIFHSHFPFRPPHFTGLTND
jgi:hypothetical protein